MLPGMCFVLASVFFCAHTVLAAEGKVTLLSKIEIETNLSAPHAIDPASWRGRPTVLYVWGDWCNACSRSTPEMLALARQYPGARFVFINTDDPARPVQAEPLPNVVDTRVQRAFFGDEVMRKKGFRFSQLGLVFGIPAYFVLDSQGRVIASGNGSRYPASLDHRLSSMSVTDQPMAGVQHGGL